MADFKTHITVSTALGVGYGAVAYAQFGVPAPTCVLAGTLCSVSGMLPDLDSDSGVPLRESLSFAAACLPMLCLDRFRHYGWSMETIALASAGVYLAIRFGIGKLLKKYTVHRGMFHSIPAAVIAGECAFLVCASGDFYLRAYKACAVMAGFLSHLILDEIWSVKVTGGRIGLKSSSGTAMKLWGDDGWANISCYGKLIALGVAVFTDPIWTTVPEGEQFYTFASWLSGEAKKVVPPKFVENMENQVAERMKVAGGTAQPPQYATAPPPYENQQYNAPQYVQPQPYTQQPYYAPQPAYVNPYPNNVAPYMPSNGYTAQPQYSQPSYAPPQQPQPYYYAPQSGQTYQYVPTQRY